MSSSMRVLTYNTQMRSALMEMGFPPSIPPVYTAPLRAKLISEAILHSDEEIDVVCLNEVFDEPARDVFSADLSGEFPYQVSKVDTFHTRIVSPGIADDILEKVWELTFGPVADVTAAALRKLEDSGLFLASRFPFATVPTPPAVTALLGPSAFPHGVPVVRFLMYADSSDNDKYAAKGVLYARLRPPGASDRHVFISHTQADTEATGENTGDRRKQIMAVAEFMTLCVGDPPFAEEVFFLGDLNIVGRGDQDPHSHPGHVPAPEWTTLFGMPGAPMFEQLVDRWGRDQCPGGSSGRTDPGFTADVVYPPVRQRLDYVFTSATSQLAVQHLRIHRELADPHGQLPYLSDHQPLLADINVAGSHCTPATALVTPDVVDFQDDDFLDDGRVKWYRFDVPGTYDVRLQQPGGDLGYEIYLGDDFSTPQPPYRDVSDPERGPRFVLAAPFFVKVRLLRRDRKGSFTLVSHRHLGQSWRDAIVLVPEQRRHEHFPAQPFNRDGDDADWDDSESKWFLVETPRIPLPHPAELGVTVSDPVEEGPEGRASAAVMTTLGRWDGVSPPASWVADSGPGDGAQQLTWQAGDDEHFFLLVQRRTATDTVVSFDIVLSTTLSLLIARPAIDTSLTCQVETSGWGADDIALEIRADGDLVADIPNSVIGDFEDDAVRHVGDKIPAPITPYVESIEVTVTEEDDFSDGEVGVGNVPLVGEVVGAPGFTVLHAGIDGRIMGSLQIGVDDGRYAFACVISRWHPSA